MTGVLDVRRLRVLVAVAEHGGIAAAARALSFTPPAVSQQIAALERQVDAVLVDRSQRSARLTPVGHRLVEHARHVLASLEAAEADLADVSGGIHGILRVATIPTVGRSLLPAALARLAAGAPDLDLRVEQLEPEESLPALRRGDVDLALAGEYGLAPRRLDASIERVDLLTEPVHVAVPDSYPHRGAHVDVADLRDARWVAPAPGSSCAVLLERSCALAGYEPHVVAHCADFSVAVALVGAGYGVTLVPAVLGCGAGAPGVRLLEARSPQIYRTVFAAVRQGSRRHPAMSLALEALTDTARAMVARPGSATGGGVRPTRG